jgi:hypothetical protein
MKPKVTPLELTEAEAKTLALALASPAPAPTAKLKEAMRRARLWFTVISCWFLVAGCGPGKQLATQEPEAPAHHHTANHTPDVGTPPSKGLAAYTKQVAAADKPGALSGFGKVFSTPEGVARRQARKDARAARPAAPLIQGKGAQFAPNANGSVQNSYKPKASAQAADSSTATASDNTKAGQRGGSAATAPGATASTTTKNGLPWWPFAVGATLVVLFIYRRRLLPGVFAAVALLLLSCSQTPKPSRWEDSPQTMTRAEIDSLSQFNY